MARVARTPLAREDLRDIASHIANESQSLEVAERFLDSIGDKCTLYASKPQLGELCPDFGTDVRRFSAGNYVVFYRPISKGIQVLRVVHGSRDIPSVWRREQ